MGVGMNVFKRQAFAGAALAVTCLLAACSGGSNAGEQPSSSEGNQPPTSEAPQDGGVEIIKPKDAAAADLCGSLPSDVATSLGLNPAGKMEKDALDPDAPQSCTWDTPDGSGGISLTAFDGRPIEDYYKRSSDYPDFAKLNIAGHPAVRANPGDARAKGACALFVATKMGQTLGSTANLVKPEQDPCAVAKKALEAAIPALPAAK